VPSQANTPRVSSAPNKAKPCVTNVFDVNSYVNTGMAIKKGDKITISARGLVTFGAYAGQGGPQGVRFGSNFNHIKDLTHGSLIGRVRIPETRNNVRPR
jgi:hypothetical protein